MWSANRQRRELLTRYGLTSLRMHGSADEISIFDDFAACWGWASPSTRRRALSKSSRLRPARLGELIERVKQKTGMAPSARAPCRASLTVAASHRAALGRIGAVRQCGL